MRKRDRLQQVRSYPHTPPSAVGERPHKIASPGATNAEVGPNTPTMFRSLLNHAIERVLGVPTPAPAPVPTPVVPASPLYGDLLTEFWQSHWSRTKHPDQVDSVLRLYLRPAFGHVRCSDITRKQVIAWHSSHSKHPRMANRALLYGRQCFAKLAPDVVNPFEKVEAFPERVRRRRFTDDERARWLVALGELRTEGVIEEVTADALFVLRGTAARKMEILGLRRDQVDVVAQIAILDNHKTESTESSRTIHLAAVMPIITRRVRECDGLFLFPGVGKTGHLVNIHKAFARVCERAGIVKSRDLCIHLLRGDFATKALSEGIDIRVIQALLGHSDPSTTARYAQASVDTAHKATVMIGESLGVQPW